MAANSPQRVHPSAVLENYSTLEVRPSQSVHEDTNKIVTWPTTVFDPSTLPEPCTPWSPKAFEQTPERTLVEDSRVCGLRRRTCFIVSAVIAVVIIGAIIGGAVGGVITRKIDEPTPASPASASSLPSPTTPSNAANRHVHPNSKVAASVLTDDSNNSLRTVFFQDPYNGLIARAWNSRSQKWQTTNLTDSLANAGHALTLSPGTPLASISIFAPDAPATENRRITQVWYLVSELSTNVGSVPIQSVYQTDKTNGAWIFDTFINQANVRAMVGSSLATAWNRNMDNNGSGVSALTYQGKDGIIYMTGGGSWATPAPLPGVSTAATRSPLALLHTMNAANGTLHDLTIGYEEGGKLVQTHLLNTEKQVLFEDPQPSLSPTPLQFAFAASRDPTLATSLVLLPDGTVKGIWKNPPLDINFSGGPPVKFFAMGTTEDFMFYGVSNDTVLEYKLDEKDPARFNFQGQVYP